MIAVLEKTKMVPLVAQWNLVNGNVCTADGGLLYIGVRSINYIGPASTPIDSGKEDLQSSTSPLIRIFHTRQSTLSVDVDPFWGKKCLKTAGGGDYEGTKFFVALNQDHSVQVWDFEKGCAIKGHKAHCEGMQLIDGDRALSRYASSSKTDQVLISYMINRNILSIDQHELVVYCVASNSYYRRTLFVPVRGHNHQITVLKCSPYNANHFALGTNRGLVLICNLQQMITLYTLRGHDTSIISLAWNRVGVKIEEKLSKKSFEGSAPEDHEQEEQTATPEVRDTLFKENSLQSTTLNSSTDLLDIESVKEYSVSNKKCPLPSIIRDMNGNQKDNYDNSSSSDDPFDIYTCNYAEPEFGVLFDNRNCEEEDMRNTLTNDLKLETTKPAPLYSTSNVKFDFIEACENLKNDIIALNDNDESRSGNEGENTSLAPSPVDVVTLEDCQRVKKSLQHCGDAYSYDDSLKEGSHDDDFCEDYSKAAPEKLLHEVEVHMAQTPELTETENISYDQISLHDIQELGDILLVSVSIDGVIWLWDAEKGSTCDHQRLRNSKKGKNTQIEAHWLSKDTIVINNSIGELFHWKVKVWTSSSASMPLKGSKKKNITFKLVELKSWPKPTLNSSSARCVVSHQTYQPSQWHWCITSNRQIQLEDTVHHKILLELSCVSSNIAAMAECPDDMNKIALGMSDRRLGIIDLSKMDENSFYIENYSQRIESQILSLSWSSDGRKIAYGTIEGRMGIVNMELNNKLTPITFNPICGKPIYSLFWHENDLLMVCNERIAVYEDANPRKDAQFIDGISDVSTISMRGDFLFVGTQKGHLKLYRNGRKDKRDEYKKFNYILQENLELFPRYVSNIDWNLLKPNRLVVSSNANSVCVLEFDDKTQKLNLEHRLQVKSSKSTNGWAKWSSGNKDQLLTCGADGIVRVWDLSGDSAPKEIFYHQFHCPMNCGLFLPSNERIILCSGRNTTLEFINIQEMDAEYQKSSLKQLPPRTLDNIQWASKVLTGLEKHKTFSKLANKTKKKQKGAKNLRSDVILESTYLEEEEESLSMDMSSSNTFCKVKNCHILRNEAGAVVMPANNEEISNLLERVTLNPTINEDMDRELRSTFMKAPTTLLYLTTKELHKEALNLMAEYLKDLKGDQKLKDCSTNSLCLQLFGTRKQAKALLELEINRNERHSATRGIADIFLPQLNVNLKETILKYAQTKQLCEWHVSLAPSISYSFWEKCSETFAEQLLEKGFALQAATYMLAIRRQQTAIQMLLKGQFYKEALLLARIYLQPDDPLREKIVNEWTEYFCSNGNLTSAALICVLSNKLRKARECLSKIRNTSPSVEAVLELLTQTIPMQNGNYLKPLSDVKKIE